MKVVISVLAAALVISGAAFAQATSPDPNQSAAAAQQNQYPTTTPPVQEQNPTATPSQQAQSQSSMADQTLTGCIARGSDQGFVLQPDSGGAAVKLSGSSDLASNLNHQARLTGHYEGGQSASATNPSGQPQPGQSSIAGKASSESSAVSNFMVTKVESISDTCSAKVPPDKDSPPTPRR
jgi:hypothetical protein